jgi:hypothetical protein
MIERLSRLTPHPAALVVGQAGKFVWPHFFPGYGKESIQRLADPGFGSFSLGDLVD